MEPKTNFNFYDHRILSILEYRHCLQEIFGCAEMLRSLLNFNNLSFVNDLPGSYGLKKKLKPEESQRISANANVGKRKAVAVCSRIKLNPTVSLIRSVSRSCQHHHILKPSTQV